MSDPGRKYWNMDIEPLLNTDRIRQRQEEKLPAAIRYCFDNVPFERRRMDKAGVTPGDIRSLEDFRSALPPVGQADFRRVYEEFDLDMDRIWLHLYGKDRMNDLFLLTTTSGPRASRRRTPSSTRRRRRWESSSAGSGGGSGCGPGTSWPSASA